MQFPDLIKLLTGKTGTELKQLGKERYPEENDLLNRTAHREGSRRLTERFGILPAQGLGVANELMEAFNMKMSGSKAPLVGFGENDPSVLMDLGDLAANARGSADAYPEIGVLVEALKKRFKR